MFSLMPYYSAGQVQRCHTMEYLEELKRTDPQIEQRIQHSRNLAKQFLNSRAHQRGQRNIIVIPVVVHVLHNGEAVGTGKNISDAQILSQITVLNEDYQALNSDISDVPSHFDSIIGNAGIQFCLAVIDPQGNAANGIDRVDIGPNESWNDNLKPGTIWDASQYLNIWVTELSGGTLGYTTFPGTSQDHDGVVVDYRYFGKTPSNPFSSKFNLGRTATHEIGHWLGLEHTFRRGCDGNSATDCNSEGDFICDTPPTLNANYGCSLPASRNTCTETPVDQPDMWMNYMDYMDDACLLMFSQGQVDEMFAVLNTSRAGILNSIACDAQNLFTFAGKVIDSQTGQGVSNSRVFMQASAVYEIETDADGNFTSLNFRPGTYAVYAGKWGYITKEFSSGLPLDANSGSITISIEKGYYDDFVLDYGWTTSATASSGLWGRGVPDETTFEGNVSNPGADLPGDFGNRCFVTGNNGGSAGNDDVDNGEVVLMSPLFDISNYNEPYINYHRWYFNSGGDGNPDDELVISISNGTQTVVIETVDASSPNSNQWNQKIIRVKDFITPSASMQFIAKTSDQSSSGHIVEAALDGFSVVDSVPVTASGLRDNIILSLYPNPASDLLNVIISGLAEPEAQLTLTDVSGKILLENFPVSNNAASQMDIARYPRGIYWAKVITEKSSVVRKFTIIR